MPSGNHLRLVGDMPDTSGSVYYPAYEPMSPEAARVAADIRRLNEARLGSMDTGVLAEEPALEFPDMLGEGF